jgi:hypothetical protein
MIMNIEKRDYTCIEISFDMKLFRELLRKFWTMKEEEEGAKVL